MADSVDPVERQILEAMARGEFDHLPGVGRPLDLGDDDPAWWARRKIAELRRLDDETERVEELISAHDELWTAPDLDTLSQRVSRINTEIDRINLTLARSRQIPRIDPSEAIRRWRLMWRLRSR